MGGCRPEHQPQQPCPSRGTEGRGREVRPSLGCGREDLEVPPPRGLRTCSHPAADTAGLSWAGHITRQTARPESEPEKRSFAKAARTAHAAPMHETLQTDIRRLRSRHSLASRERRVPRCADTHLRLPSCRSSATEFPHLTAAVASKAGAKQGKTARPIQVPRHLPRIKHHMGTTVPKLGHSCSLWGHALPTPQLPPGFQPRSLPFRILTCNQFPAGSSPGGPAACSALRHTQWGWSARALHAPLRNCKQFPSGKRRTPDAQLCSERPSPGTLLSRSAP